MISEAEIEKALDYLRDSAGPAAQARANRIYLENYSKVVKALAMSDFAANPLGAQERMAYASGSYSKHLDALKVAVEDDARYQFFREAALAKIEAWRTQSSNQRANI